MSWTSPQDVLDRWVGGSAPTDLDLVQALINDAEAVILSEYPKIQQRINENELAVSTVVLVVSRMVTRLLRNPEGLTYWQQQTGPFGQGRTYGEATDIWLSDNERSLLAPNKTGKAFSVNLGPNATAPTYWPFPAPYDYDPVWREVK